MQQSPIKFLFKTFFRLFASKKQQARHEVLKLSCSCMGYEKRQIQNGFLSLFSENWGVDELQNSTLSSGGIKPCRL